MKTKAKNLTPYAKPYAARPFGAQTRSLASEGSKLVVGLLSLLLFASFALPLRAQSVRFKAGRVRVTVPPNYTGSAVITNLVTVGNLVDPVYFDVSGLPSGATYTLSDALGNPLPSTLNTTSLWVNLNLANVAKGVYTFSLNASVGATNNLLLTLQVGNFWSGADLTGNTNWSVAANWQGGVPGASDDVIFSDAGAQASMITNSVVDSSTTIGSLRFCSTNSTSFIQTLLLNPGVTLSVTGDNGLSFLRDYIGSIQSVGGKMTANFAGDGTLAVLNEAANIALLGADNSVQTTLDLSRLGFFKSDVNRIGLGDYQLWPNFDNLSSSNLYNGIPSKFYSVLYLARTNVVKAIYMDPDNFTNSVKRDYSFTLGNNERGGTSSSPVYNVYLGLSNVFYVDSLCISHASMSGNMQFNSAFTSSNPVAIFRGANGGRMSMWAESDIGQGTAAMASGSNDKTTVDLSGGTVDALIDRLYLSRDRINASGQNAQSTLTLALGTFDVNTAILGYQGEGNHTNTAYCEGTLNIRNTATFKVNDELILGYTTADPGDPTQNDIAGNGGTWGKINLGPGGTLLANTISCGGATKTSLNQISQFISMTGGAVLAVTNTLGSASAPLYLLSLTNGSALTLSINDLNTKIFVKNLATSGAGANANVINVASVSGISSYPANIPIISYINPSTAAFVVGTLPSGMVGSVVNDTLNSVIVLTINTNTPQTLVWRGAVNGVWDTTTSNWVTQVGLNPTRWVDTDFAVFDDTATGPTTITVAADVIPGQSVSTPGILVSSSSLNYSFNGPNTIRGGATLQKAGGTTLTLNANTENSVLLSQGTLAGSGTLGATVVQAGTTMTGFTGFINGGLDVSNATVAIPAQGTVAGSVVVRAGSLINNGTITGTVALQTNTYLANGGTMNVTCPWSVPTNAVLVNNGVIVQTGPSGGNQGLTVNGGTLMGAGKITTPGTIATSDARVTIGPGGSLIIGNSPNEITNVIIATRLDFFGASTTTFDVDPSVGNDMILLTDGYLMGKVNFGQNAALGGTLVINHVSGPAFTPSTVLHLFDLTLNSPDNSVPAKPEVTPPPGPGMVWDISNMLTNLTLAVTGPPTMGTVFSYTNLTLSWPDLYKGWRLEVQTNDLGAGLSTNWYTVGGSITTNQMAFPIDTNAGSVFYRLIYP